MYKVNILPKNLIDVATDIAILGGILTALNQPFWACSVWFISNPYLAYHNHKIGQTAQRNFFIVMSIVTIIGIFNLWPK